MAKSLQSNMSPSNVFKSCCGSICVVDGSDLCCHHQVRKGETKIFRYTRDDNEYLDIATVRYYCATCDSRRRKHRGYFSYVEAKSMFMPRYTPDRNKAFSNITIHQHTPQLIMASTKKTCRHYCRNHSLSHDLCCQCLLHREETQPHQSQMCDCCRERKNENDPRSKTHRIRYSVSRGDRRRSHRNTAPKLNNPFLNLHEYQIEEDELDDPTNELSIVGTSDATKITVDNPAIASSKDSSVLVSVSDDHNWPPLMATKRNNHERRQEAEGESIILSTSSTTCSGILVDMSHADVDENISCSSTLTDVVEDHEWEVLSAGLNFMDDEWSAWTMLSAFHPEDEAATRRHRDDSSSETPLSFRDALLRLPLRQSPQYHHHKHQQPPRLYHFPKPNINASTPSSRYQSKENITDDNDCDWMAEICGNTKLLRGGKESKWFHRGREQHNKSFKWRLSRDAEGRMIARRKEFDLAKRQCRSLAG